MKKELIQINTDALIKHIKNQVMIVKTFLNLCSVKKYSNQKI